MAVGYKYDVAFSFLDEDEPAAREIATRLVPLSTFVYSERQLDLGGTDGVEAFTAVFRRDTRIAVVLHRENWGKTKWTRIEADAIKSRYLEEGADFVLLVQMESCRVPDWFPSARIWVDLERFGRAGAASIINERLKQVGGNIHPETPQENAARLERERRAESERLALFRSDEGVRLANQTVNGLFDRLESLSSETGIEFDREPQYALLFRDGHSVAIVWSYHYRNSLDHAELRLTRWRGRPNIGQKIFASFNKKELSASSFDFNVDMSEPRVVTWDERGGATRRLSNDGFAEHAVHELLNLIRTARQPD